MVICKDYQNGKCWRGSACKFQHTRSLLENPNRSVNSERTSAHKSRSISYEDGRRGRKNSKEHGKTDTRYEPGTSHNPGSSLTRKNEERNDKLNSNKSYRRESPETIKSRNRDYSYRDKDFRDRSTPRSRKDLTRTCSKVNIEPESRAMSPTESGEKTLSEVSNPSESLKSNKVGKKSNKDKEGRIYCVCSFQSYETSMLKCQFCKSFSHADCYEVFNLNIKHICGSCAIKENRQCTNEKIKIFMEKQNKTKEEHSNFAFNLMLRRAMNSILKEEFKSTQPGVYGVDFIRIRFNMSSAYANKMMLHLVQNGNIAFYGGFQVDKQRIKNFLYPNGDLDLEWSDIGYQQKESSISDQEISNAGYYSLTGRDNSCILISDSDDDDNDEREQEEDVLEVGQTPISTKSQIIEQASGSQGQPNVNASSSNDCKRPFSNSEDSDDDLDNDNEPTSCTMCSKTFSSKSDLKYHLGQHENKNKFYCNQCQRFFPLANHKFHGFFLCSDCKRIFKSELSLTHHQQDQHSNVSI